MNTEILLPSYVDSFERLEFMLESLFQIESHLDKDVLKTVIFDSPSSFSLKKRIFTRVSNIIYKKNGWCVQRGDDAGSLEAVLKALSISKSRNIFMHLDDHCYNSKFSELLRIGDEYISEFSDVFSVRLSGRPLISDEGHTYKIVNGEIVIDDLILMRSSYKGTYIYSTSLEDLIKKTSIWPVTLWFCIMNRRLLQFLLDNVSSGYRKSLATAENYFLSEDGVNFLLKNYGKKRVIFIDMQKGGFEMHRNPNWSELIEIENPTIC